MAKRPTDDQLAVAAMWLRENEGEGAELESCRAVATWIDEQISDAFLRREARTAGVSVARLRAKLSLLTALCLLMNFAPPARATEDDFHHLPLAAYALMTPGASTIPTHLCVTGNVRYVRKERDGDIHVRLCNGSLCIVAEIIPAVPLLRPRKGSRIEACGITRYDGLPNHGWHELHPLLSWTVAP